MPADTPDSAPTDAEGRSSAVGTNTAGGTASPTASLTARTRWLALLKRWPRLLLACFVAFGLEHLAVHALGGSGTDTLSQGLFSLQALYGRAVSSWPRELVPRYTAIVHIDPESDPTAEGLAYNVCQQRRYLTSLLPALAERQPAAIVIDKYFTLRGCNDPEPTAALRATVEKVSESLPVIVGLVIADNVSESSATVRPPVLKTPLPFALSSSLREGVVNLDLKPHRVPLGWTVRRAESSAAAWQNGIALEAALAHEPTLFEKSPRLQKLKDAREHPFIDLIGERLFNTLQASDVLCKNTAAAKEFASACARAKPVGFDPSYVRGRIVILGESGSSLDQHDTALIGRVPGTVLQANYVEALLDGRYFLPSPWLLDYALGFVFFVILELSLLNAGFWQAAWRSAVLLMATFALLSLAARYLGYHVDPAVSVAVLVFSLIGRVRELIGPHKEARDGT